MEVKIFKSKSVFVGCMYRPPNSSLYMRKDFNKNLNGMLAKVNNVSIETLLLGFINVDYVVKSSHKEIKEFFYYSWTPSTC